ncbi:MAG TPA: NADH-quinone oxidoreductase subunit J [Anaeromyxobacteraceae bacterium]|nr:NADH-quinone oxidoreductase subunit J [Anaeromyxobacteraceae bacterium]
MRPTKKLLAWTLGSAAVIAAVGVLSARLSPALAAGGARPAAGPFTLADGVFWFLAALTVGGAAGVALSRNILYSALGLLASLLGVAGLYVFLSADFVAVAQIMIYIGGVLVLILFAVMLTNRIGEVKVSNASMGWASGGLLAALMLGLLLVVAFEVPWAVRPMPALPTTAPLGHGLLQRWLLPFELASLILLATLIGAIIIARKEIRAE